MSQLNEIIIHVKRGVTEKLSKRKNESLYAENYQSIEMNR